MKGISWITAINLYITKDSIKRFKFVAVPLHKWGKKTLFILDAQKLYYIQLWKIIDFFAIINFNQKQTPSAVTQYSILIGCSSSYRQIQ